MSGRLDGKVEISACFVLSAPHSLSVYTFYKTKLAVFLFKQTLKTVHKYSLSRDKKNVSAPKKDKALNKISIV